MILHDLTHARRQHFHRELVAENRKLRRLWRNAEHVADKRDWHVLALLALAVFVALAWRLV